MTVNPLTTIKATAIYQKYQEYGENAILVIIDNGINIFHESLRDDKGKTRILELWDQGIVAEDGDSNLVPTGKLYSQDDINRFIANPTMAPKSLLPPLDIDHATNVASIAAGRATKGFTGGVAPKAHLLIVQTSAMNRISNAPSSLGYSVSVHTALAFVLEASKRYQLPMVINLSSGLVAGANDGSSNLEVAIDYITAGGRLPGMVIVKSAGNETLNQKHAWIQMISNMTERLQWVWDDHSNDITCHIEIWFDSADDLLFRLSDTKGTLSDLIGHSQSTKYHKEITKGISCSISYTRYSPDNGNSRLLISMSKNSSAQKSQKWELIIQSKTIRGDGNIQAQIEGDSVRFINHIDSKSSISTPAGAHSVIVVGAANTQIGIEPANFSSLGPTRDGRLKPEIAAPGDNILVASGLDSSSFEHKSGTSIAAAFVSGTIALAFSFAQKQIVSGSQRIHLNARQISKLLASATQNQPSKWHPSLGYGLIDAELFTNSMLDLLWDKKLDSNRSQQEREI